MELNVDNANAILAKMGVESADQQQAETSTSQAPVASQGGSLAAIAEPNASAAVTATSAISIVDQKADRMQLIDDEQQFNSSEFGPKLRDWGLEDAGFGYDLCAVLGSQSTGKSTLLNKLFGTSFDVMDEKQRRQTTKGIWMCRGLKMNVLVMDVEGTDGRERGEDQDFERKSALFSMASAEVLIVNLWEHQVGLYQGANMGLLKTVFEVNLGLFQAGKAKTHGAKDKTLLLFVIRDHVGTTPLENLQATLMSDLHKIWDSLSKPDGLEQSQISDFFDFMFTTLPHKILLPAEFDKAVDKLRSRFVDPKDPNFVFRTEYHKRIPADGLPHYLNSIWDQVMTNKDLDLPTQQELLAQFRCDEIANAAFATFSGEVKGFRKHIESGTVLETLGADMALHRGNALVKFDKDAGRYHQEVYKRKRIDLLEKLNSTLSPFFLGQLKNLHKVILAAFKNSVLERMRNESNYDFGEVVGSEKERAQVRFDTAAKLLLLPDTDWTIAEEETQLEEDIQSIADTMRVEETKKMVAQIERNLKKGLAEPVELALNKPIETMWDKVLEAFRTVLQQAESTYLRKAKSFNCTDDENAAALVLLRRKSWISLRAKVDEQTADTVLAAKLRSCFEDRFRYDENGVPRVWKPEDDIDGAYQRARDETLALIPLYAKIKPKDESLAVTLPSTSDDSASQAAVDRGEEEEFDFPATLTVFTEGRKAEIGVRFRKEADALYVEAKRSTVSSIAQIPLWMYGVMVVLGWNEMMAVLRSPVYFAFLLACLASAYVVWKLNLGGPLASVSKAVGREVHRLADEQLRNHFSQPLPRPQVLEERYASQGQGNSTAAKGEEIELQEKRS
ncbi:Dynamin-like GTPase that mediates homotypic ER fusion [Thecaphora frezii]|nr:putative GTP-binding protein Sey1 [Thecaphora frezii]